MESVRFAVDVVLRQDVNPAGVILYVDVVILESEIHGVEQRDELSCTKIYPHEFFLAGFAAHE